MDAVTTLAIFVIYMTPPILIAATITAVWNALDPINKK